MVRLICLLAVLLFLASVFCGCQNLQVGAPAVDAPKAEEQISPMALAPVKLKAAWDDPKHLERNEWTLHLYIEVLKSSLPDRLPEGIKKFCPSYYGRSREETSQFWVGLISKMAKYESNFNPASKYGENFKDSKGAQVVSRGLLQISLESSKAYGCGFKSVDEIHDPLKNLSCAVRIMDNRVTRKGAIEIPGSAAYWSVIKLGHKNNKSVQIAAFTKELSFCK